MREKNSGWYYYCQDPDHWAGSLILPLNPSSGTVKLRYLFEQNLFENPMMGLSMVLEPFRLNPHIHAPLPQPTRHQRRDGVHQGFPVK